MIMHKKHQMNLCNFTVLHFLKEENIIKSSDEFKAFERKSLEKGEKVTKWSDVLNKENI